MIGPRSPRDPTSEMKSRQRCGVTALRVANCHVSIKTSQIKAVAAAPMAVKSSRSVGGR